MISKADQSNFIKTTAKNLGFDFCGIAEAVFLSEDAKRLESWLNKGLQGKMSYMENYFDLRVDPCKLVPGARSVITLLLNYFPADKQNESAPKISKYAYGEDYHEVIRGKINDLQHRLKEKLGNFNGRGFVDSAPVLERTWAQRSGLGWVGKNGNLISTQQGSFFFIASLIIDMELEYDSPFVKDYCGSCTRCIDNCPTDAILPDKVIDGSKCISYFTIELKDALIPENMQGHFKDWMFGCDICQDVCPWNRFSKPTDEIRFTPLPEIFNFSTSDWEDMSEESFKSIFKNSAIKRTKFQGIKRNLKFIKNL